MEAAPTTRTERRSRNSPQAAPGDNTVRFSMRSLLWVTTCAAVVLAVAAPYSTQLSSAAVRSLIFQFAVTVLIIGLPTVLLRLWMDWRLKKFAEEHDSKLLLPIIPIRYRLPYLRGVWLGTLVAMSTVVAATTEMHRPQASELLSFVGMNVGMMYLTYYFDGKLRCLVGKGGIVSVLGKFPWSCFSGIALGVHKDVIRLRRWLPDLQIYVPPERREEVLRVIEQHTGHTLQEPLEEFLENHQSSGTGDAG